MTKKEFIHQAAIAACGNSNFATRDELDYYHIGKSVVMLAETIGAAYPFDVADFETKESIKTFVGQISDHLGQLVNDDEGNSVISAIHEVVKELKTTNERLDDLRTGSCVEIKNP